MSQTIVDWIKRAFDKDSKRRASEAAERYARHKMLVEERARGASFCLPLELLSKIVGFGDVASYGSAVLVNTELSSAFEECSGDFWRCNLLQSFPIARAFLPSASSVTSYKALFKSQVQVRTKTGSPQVLPTRSLDEFVFSFELSVRRTGSRCSLCVGVVTASGEGEVCLNSEPLSKAVASELFSTDDAINLVVMSMDKVTGKSALLFEGAVEDADGEYLYFPHESTPVRHVVLDWMEGHPNPPCFESTAFIDFTFGNDGSEICDGAVLSVEFKWSDSNGFIDDPPRASPTDLMLLLEHFAEFK